MSLLAFSVKFPEPDTIALPLILDPGLCIFWETIESGSMGVCSSNVFPYLIIKSPYHRVLGQLVGKILY